MLFATLPYATMPDNFRHRGNHNRAFSGLVTLNAGCLAGRLLSTPTCCCAGRDGAGPEILEHISRLIRENRIAVLGTNDVYVEAGPRMDGGCRGTGHCGANSPAGCGAAIARLLT